MCYIKGVEAPVDDPDSIALVASEVETCVNSCPYSRDGICDDPRGGNYCKLGTDCQVAYFGASSCCFQYFLQNLLNIKT